MASSLRLIVPPAQYGGLENIRQLSDEAVQQLANALSDAPITTSPQEFVTYLAPVVQIKPQTLEEIVKLLVSLSSVRIDLEVSVPDLVDAVVKAMNRTELEDFRLDEHEQQSFKERLSKLLEPQHVLGIVAKVNDLWYEGHHVFIDARIVTDIRPIFKPDPSQLPVAGLIVHNLKLTYREGVEERELFIAMDASHVRQLRALLTRADVKAQSLKALLDSVGVPALDGEVGDGNS